MKNLAVRQFLLKHSSKLQQWWDSWLRLKVIWGCQNSIHWYRCNLIKGYTKFKLHMKKDKEECANYVCVWIKWHSRMWPLVTVHGHGICIWLKLGIKAWQQGLLMEIYSYSKFTFKILVGGRPQFSISLSFSQDP